jgi:hypothetical protein
MEQKGFEWLCECGASFAHQSSLSRHQVECDAFQVMFGRMIENVETTFGSQTNLQHTHIFHSHPVRRFHIFHNSPHSPSFSSSNFSTTSAVPPDTVSVGVQTESDYELDYHEYENARDAELEIQDNFSDDEDQYVDGSESEDETIVYDQFSTFPFPNSECGMFAAFLQRTKVSKRIGQQILDLLHSPGFNATKLPSSMRAITKMLIQLPTVGIERVTLSQVTTYARTYIHIRKSVKLISLHATTHSSFPVRGRPGN